MGTRSTRRRIRRWACGAGLLVALTWLITGAALLLSGEAVEGDDYHLIFKFGLLLVGAVAAFFAAYGIVLLVCTMVRRARRPAGP